MKLILWPPQSISVPPVSYVLDGVDTEVLIDTVTPANNKLFPVQILGTSPLPAGAATEAKQDVGNTSLGNIDTKTPALVSGRTPVDGSGVTQPISATTLPLPTGAATETTLGSINIKTPALIAGRVPVDGSGVTQPVSLASAPLATGAATEAKQDTGNTSLGNIDTKTPALIAGRTPVDGSGVTQPISATALPLPTGAATEAKQDTGNTSLGNIDTKTPALVGGRTPVDGSGVTQPISATALPLPTGAATEAKQDTGNTSLASLNGKLAASLVPEDHDELEITYVGATDDIDTVVYKEATVTVATLTMSYDGNGRLSGVVRS